MHQVACTNDDECDDLIDCTIDQCSSSGVCVYNPDDTLCTDSAAPVCNPHEGCVAADWEPRPDSA